MVHPNGHYYLYKKKLLHLNITKQSHLFPDDQLHIKYIRLSGSWLSASIFYLSTFYSMLFPNLNQWWNWNERINVFYLFTNFFALNERNMSQLRGAGGGCNTYLLLVTMTMEKISTKILHIFHVNGKVNLNDWKKKENKQNELYLAQKLSEQWVGLVWVGLRVR